MNRQLFLAIIVAGATLSANAQTEADALRYSQITFGGTARYNSMAGAFGALGADFSTLSSNPAGLGLYRKSEITFTPNSFNQTTNSTYMNTGGNGSNTESGSKYNANLQNLGLVGVFGKNKAPEEGGWQSFNMGFGYNQLANFNNSQSAQGYSYAHAGLGDVIASNADGQQVGSMDPNSTEYLAYQAYLINNPNNATQYMSLMPTGGGVLQQNSITSGGYMGETVLSFAGNYNNRLYIGGTIGFQHIDYSSSSSYSETALTDSVGGVHSFGVAQNLTTTGNGVNLKLGIIYRINDWMRVGLAAHSPTQFYMHDSYSTTVSTNFKDSAAKSYTGYGAYDYNLVTPPRVIGSLGFVVAKRGLIGIDFEYVDYTYASLSSADAGVFDAANNNIQAKYTAAGNLRVGAEWKVIDNISLRAGYALYGNPYQSGSNVNAGRTSYTAGIGFREKNLSIDLAYVYTVYNENYYFYDPSIANVNPVQNTFNTTNVMLTLGLRF